MRLLALAWLALFLLADIGVAQDPVRLPGVNVTAKPDKVPSALVGFVVDTAGNGIEGAEVTVPELKRRTFTRYDGSFRIDSVRKGVFQMRARKIGYAAQVREFEVDSLGGYAQFSLMPIVTGLAPMVSTATRRGLSGNVADMALHGIPDAVVKVLGAGMYAKTDVRGDFFLPVETGRYMVAIEKDSFATKLVSVVIPPDSGRNINAWLMPGGKVEKEHFWNVVDLGQRQAWTKPQGKVLFTREDLVRMKIEWVSDAINTTETKFNDVNRFDRDCFAVVNGGPEMANMAAITIDDVESVEVYPIGTGNSSLMTVEASKSQLKMVRPGFENSPRPKGGDFVWLDNARAARMANAARHCPLIYVWLR
jgi:hypothetical protein